MLKKFQVLGSLVNSSLVYA